MMNRALLAKIKKRSLMLGIPILDRMKGKQLHFAYICRGKNIMVMGVNKYKFSRKELDLIKSIFPNRTRNWPHAETDAIARAIESGDISRATSIVVVRVKHYGLAMSKPCRMCMDVINSFNIRECWWSVDNNTFSNGETTKNLVPIVPRRVLTFGCHGV